MFQRGRRDDQHPLDAGGLGENLDRRDGLNGLAQAHVVGNQRAAGLGGEQRPFALIRIERHLQQSCECLGVDSARKGRLHSLGQMRLVAHLGDEPQGVVIAAELVPVRRGLVQELVEAGEGLGHQAAVVVKETPGERLQRRGAIHARPEDDFPLRPVLQVDLGILRLIAQRQGPLGARPAAQAVEHVFDVLAGAQRVDGEVGAGAEVLAQRLAADRHPISPSGLGIGDLELGEERFVAEVLDAEFLRPGELPPQRHLPLVQGHFFRLPQPGEPASSPCGSAGGLLCCGHNVPPRHEIRTQPHQFSTGYENCLDGAFDHQDRTVVALAGGVGLESRLSGSDQLGGRKVELALQGIGNSRLAEGPALAVGGVAEAVGEDDQRFAGLQLAAELLELGLGTLAQHGRPPAQRLPAVAAQQHRRWPTCRRARDLSLGRLQQCQQQRGALIAGRAGPERQIDLRQHPFGLAVVGSVTAERSPDGIGR